MKRMYLISMPIFLLGVCNAADMYSYRPKDEMKSAEDLISKLNLTVKTLDLSGHKEVDDNFVKTLSESDKSKTLINIDLSNTSISDISLQYILESKKLGTQRDLPQISARYDLPSSEIYLNVEGTKVSKENKEKFGKPFSGVKLSYAALGGKKTADDAIGIKMLTFKSSTS